MKKRLFALALSISMIMAQVTPTFAVNLEGTETLDTEIENVEAQTEETEIQTEAERLEENIEVEETAGVEESESDISETEGSAVDTYAADGLVATLANNEVSSAISVNVNTTYKDSLVDKDDVNWYKFTISGAGYISLDFKHDYIESGNTYWKAHLYNPEQKELVGYSFSGNQTSYSQGTIGLPTGTYYLKVERDYTSDKEYNFTINYTASSVWETEFNNDYTTSDSINVNTTYYGSLMNRDDVDWYKFNVPNNGYISLDFKHDYIESGSTYWKAHLYNSEQKEVINYSFDGNKTSYTKAKIGVPAGTYYMKIERDYTSDRDYNFKINYTASDIWETEFNNDYTTSNQISVNKSYYGSLMNGDDVDWYKFTTSSAGYISFSFKHEYIESSSTYWQVHLYNPEQRELVTYDFDGNVTSYTKGKIGIPAGTYYLKIEDYSYNCSDTPYNFKVDYTASSVWETEFNNDYTTADKISYGKTYYGSLMNGDDNDWYKVDIPSGGNKIIYFKHDAVTEHSSWIYWNIRLYDSSMSEIWNLLSAGSETSLSRQIKLSAGTYYFKIENYDYNCSDKTYNFQISGVVSKPGKTTLKKSTNDSNGNIKVNWEKVKDAKGYRIYKKDSNGNYKKVADVASDKTSYTDKSGSIGSKYTYTVRAYKKSGDQYVWGDYDKKGVTGQKTPAKVTLSKIKNNTSGQVNLTWEKVSGADGYRVYRKASGESWTKLKDVTATSITDKTGKMGVTYSYTVRAYKKVKDKMVLGNYDSKGLSGKKVPSKVQVTSAKYQKDKGVTVNWKKTSDCSGYVIYRKDDNSGWTKLAKVSGKDKVKYTDKVKKNLDTYKYTVRAYTTVNGKEILGVYDTKGVSVTK